MKIGCGKGDLVSYISEQQGVSEKDVEKLIENYDGLYKYSEDIGVPVEFLKKLNISFEDDKIRIPYYDEDNQEIGAKLISKDNKSNNIWEW